ncbi:MAG: hypothetical protein IVW54_18505 [Candidatus Binataceae bacterium]|nr:hypothetical protein [Candidatus Binataceae bacterium]
MYDTLECHVIENGIWFTGGILFIVLLIVIALLALATWVTIRILPAVIRARRSEGTVAVGDARVGTKGPITGLWIPFVWIVFLAVIGYAAWRAYDFAEGYYAVSIDANNAPTLERLREDLVATDQRTHVTIKIADNVKDLRVQGVFEGKCVADVMEAICRANYRELTCMMSYSDRSITIERAPGRRGS